MRLSPLRRSALALCAGLSSWALAQPAVPTAPAPAERPLAALPYTPSLDLTSLDRGADPCADFYAFACGHWIVKNPIPPDQPRWNVYGKLGSENEQFLWGMLESAARPDPGRSPAQQKIGDYFGACMDEAAADRAGLAPIQEELNAIAALRDKGALAPLLGRLHLSQSGNGMLFGFGAEQDLRDSSRVIAWAVAGGLGLPDRDYYTKGPDTLELRDKYRAFVQRSLALAGDAPPVAKAGADDVLRIETALALKTLTRVEQRDPRKLDHKQSLEQLQRLTPSFAWPAYLRAAGLQGLRELNVSQPEFFAAVEGVLTAEGLGALKTYLRWQLLRSRSPYLSRPLAEASFEFYGRTLRGTQQQAPRWKRCVQWVDRDLGEALGQVFVERAFGPELKASALDMVGRIERAMERRLGALPWMSAQTKRQALEKLHAMRNKIGYPERWRDYSSLQVAPGDFMGNVRRAAEFESRRQLGKIGAPIDRGEWAMTPPTVNAYYNPLLNDINFPAGVLQPPLFDPKMDAAPNYGNTGGTIGHELIHGFDDEGRRFDAQGNLRDWWSEQDGPEFERRAQCILDQYARYTVVDDIKINSRLTLGEDVADLAGLILAWDAWRELSAGEPPAPRDGFTPEQRFFIGFAQWDCGSERDENKRVNALTNPHSPSQYRINGVLVNMPEFAQAFGCRQGQPMVKPPEGICRIW